MQLKLILDHIQVKIGLPFLCYCPRIFLSYYAIELKIIFSRTFWKIR